MKANKKSIHARLYKFTYSSDLPDNLCPYFWKVLFGILMFIPNFILQIPVLIINLFTDNFKDDAKTQRIKGASIYIVSFVLYMYIYGTYHAIKGMLSCYSYKSDIANFGIFFNLFILIILTTLFCCYLNDKRKERKSGLQEDNIIKEFVKAKYHKYCPKIDWND